MWMLVDGNNWFARDFFAQGPGCVGTFLKRLGDVRADRDYERVFVCWDSPSFRCKLSPGYKAHRGEKPDGFEKSLAELRNEVDAMDVASLRVDGFEADDLIGTLAQMALDEGEKATIFSADRDLHQCLASGCVNQVTLVERVTRREIRYHVMTDDKLRLKYGVAPYQWVDYRTIIGDSSDGLKGCPGLGPTAAVAVLLASGSLDAFYAEPFRAKLTKRQHALLMNFRPDVPLMRQMIALRKDVPLSLEAVA